MARVCVILMFMSFMPKVSREGRKPIFWPQKMAKTATKKSTPRRVDFHIIANVLHETFAYQQLDYPNRRFPASPSPAHNPRC